MYANLKVTDDLGSVHSAWKIEVLPRSVLVYLDRSEGSGDTPEPAGTLQLTNQDKVVIEADF
jgi:hypothetical protein